MSKWLQFLICILLIGCDTPLDSEPLESTVQFSLLTDGSFVSADHIVLNLTSGGWSKSVDGSSQTPHSDADSWWSDFVEFPTDHPLTVVLAITLSQDTLAFTELEFDVEGGYAYFFTVYAGQGDPRDFFSGKDFTSVPLRNRPLGFARDSIYIRWWGTRPVPIF